MNKALVVVESPAKAKTIEKFLGKGFTVMASMGHLRDLPKSQFGVDVDNDFTPKYINIRGKGDLIKKLKEEARKATSVYLATDPDREGEAIAWHLANLLNIPAENNCRIEFNEITKLAIQKAVKSPRQINIPRVDAQQARRILDRIVGYKLSPLLWRKVRKGLSAGRVQSVTVRLICDREKEILAFISEEYWTIGVKLRENSKSPSFDAELVAIDGEKVQIVIEQQAAAVVQELEKEEFAVQAIKRRERRRNPAPPFITSTLQQDASRKLGFTSRKTMIIAQQLYEGIEIATMGAVGLITYMRTDSTRVATSAQQEAREYIETNFGGEFLPEKPPVYANKKSQDAHEAIRPTSFTHQPQKLVKSLTRDQLRLYTLIWERFIASQMKAAIYDTITVDIKAGRFGLRANGSLLKFPGFTLVYSDSKEEAEKDTSLPEVSVGTKLQSQNISPKQHFTEPPPRYNEASLVKILEEKGIGRPSTYAPIIETIVTRGYVDRVEKKFQPTDLGFVVVDLLKEYFPHIVDVDFTAGMEHELDDIADGERTRNSVLGDFYGPFAITLAAAEEQIGQVELPVEVSEIQCEHCGRFMVVKHGRFGNFLACPGFPTCRNTKAIVKDIGIPCPKCQGAIVERRTKRGKNFYGCIQYPQCDFTTWDMPLKDICTSCGHFMVKHNFRQGRFAIMCGNENCTTRVKKEVPKKVATTAPPKKKGKSQGVIKAGGKSV